MRQIPLSEIEAFEDGEVLTEISGHVKAVYERKSGVGEYGPWSFQDLTLTDGDIDVRIKAKNLEDLKDFQGKDITITANKSPKHGLTGLTKLVEEYQGKTYHKVQLTSSCKINGKGTEEPDEIPMDHDSQGQALTGVTEARQHIMRAVNLYVLCVDAVDAVIKPHIEGMTAELYQAAIGSLFIESSRSGLISKMPNTPIKKP
jgi:hypothetical protein